MTADYVLDDQVAGKKQVPHDDNSHQSASSAFSLLVYLAGIDGGFFADILLSLPQIASRHVNGSIGPAIPNPNTD